MKTPFKITFLNEKGYLEDGEAVLLSSEGIERLFQINKVKDVDSIIKNNSIIIIEADDGEKMKSICTSYDKKHHNKEKNIDLFDVQLEEGVKNNFEFYFVIEK